MTSSPSATRTKLLDAARDVIRARGYAATSVDDICAAAGVSKGSFFHYFETKEKLAIAAAGHFGAGAAAIFGGAPYAALPDPRDRLIGYVDFRIAMLGREIPQFTCLLGTMVQEVYATHPDLRTAAEAQLADHIAMLTRDVAAAKALYAPDAPWSAGGLATFMQATLQGAFIFAKAQQSPQAAVECLTHLRRYLELVFNQPHGEKTKGKTMSGKITVEATIAAPIAQVWRAWNTPDDIKQWNAASDDWHTTKSAVDLRAGGAFSSRMEAKDGSMGFDFAGTYTKVVEHKLIESEFGGRALLVEFVAGKDGVTVRETFDAESTHSIEQQRGGWQAILNNFKKHVEASRRA